MAFLDLQTGILEIFATEAPTVYRWTPGMRHSVDHLTKIERDRAWRAAHPKQQSDYYKAYRAAHKAEKQAYNATYRQTHKEEINARARASYAARNADPAYREKINAQVRARYAANKKT